ncbi:MAG: GLPGLI family protein [Flavobacteriaceae bacterium]|nr:GLPGLI family protein [Flavobacteriaceae bacterium]
MPKPRSIFQLLFLFTPLVALSQNAAAIVYKINFLDSEYLNQPTQNKNEFLESLILDAKDFLKETSFLLKINGDESEFKAREQIATKNQNLSKFAYTLVNGDGLYYTNLTDKETLHQMDAYGSQIILKTSFEYYKWHLTGESKKIGKYVCYKAVTNRKKTEITAWFTPHIPLRFGPAGFGNLPGLILELSFDNNLSTIVYYSSQINFEKDEPIKIKKPTKGKIINQSEFDQMGEKAKENLKRMGN